jgi:uncharacterized protein YaaW (UPF0174 family)
VIAAPKPASFYFLLGAQAGAALLLAVGSASAFEASLGNSQIESLEMVAAVAGLLIAGGIALTARWAWLGAMIWVCAVMTLQLIRYAGDDSPAYAVMVPCLVQVACLQLTDVKRLLLAHRSSAPK